MSGLLGLVLIPCPLRSFLFQLSLVLKPLSGVGASSPDLNSLTIRQRPAVSLKKTRLCTQSSSWVSWSYIQSGGGHGWESPRVLCLCFWLISYEQDSGNAQTVNQMYEWYELRRSAMILHLNVCRFMTAAFSKQLSRCWGHTYSQSWLINEQKANRVGVKGHLAPPGAYMWIHQKARGNRICRSTASQVWYSISPWPSNFSEIDELLMF